MTRITIDTFATRPPWNCGGIYEYTRHLLRYFQFLAPEYGCDVTALVGQDYHSLVEGLQNSASFRTIAARGIGQPRIWRYGGCSLQSRKLGTDVVFLPTSDVLPILMPPYVVTVYDIPFLETNSYSRFKNWRFRMLGQQVAQHASAILAISEYTKADYVRYLGIEPKKITVAYLSYNRDRYNTEPLDEALRHHVSEKWKLQRPYILHCGTLQPRKNLVRLIEAYDRMLTQHPNMDFDLVLAGMMGWQYDPILEAAGRVVAPKRVVLTGQVNEDELVALVKGASLSVIPSLCEGFSLPMLESMACGVPTIVANSTCLPEVSGGVLRYFDGESVEQIAETMYDVLQSPSEQQRLRRDGLKRASEFSWERCARQTLEVLRRVATRS